MDNQSKLFLQVGVYFVFGIALLVILYEVMSDGGLFEHGIEYHSYFENVRELKTGDPVKLGGMQVGKVTMLAVLPQKIKVTFMIDETISIKEDAIAQIRFSGLIGQNYIYIDFGTESADMLTAGNALAARESVDINDAVEAVQHGLEQLQEQIKGLSSGFDKTLNKLSSLLDESGGNLAATLENAKSITGQIVEGRGTLGRLIMGEDVYDQISGVASAFEESGIKAGELIDDVQAFVADIRAGNGTVGKLLVSDELYNTVTDISTNVQAMAQMVRDGEGTLGKLIMDSDLYDTTQGTIQNLQRSMEGLDDQGPLTVIGIAAGQLF